MFKSKTKYRKSGHSWGFIVPTELRCDESFPFVEGDEVALSICEGRLIVEKVKIE